MKYAVLDHDLLVGSRYLVLDTEQPEQAGDEEWYRAIYVKDSRLGTPKLSLSSALVSTSGLILLSTRDEATYRRAHGPDFEMDLQEYVDHAVSNLTDECNTEHTNLQSSVDTPFSTHMEKFIHSVLREYPLPQKMQDALQEPILLSKNIYELAMVFSRAASNEELADEPLRAECLRYIAGRVNAHKVLCSHCHQET